MTALAKQLTIQRLATHLYDYLPGKAHPFGKRELSFEAVASKNGLTYDSGSKTPAIISLINQSIENKKFNNIIIDIVNLAIYFKAKKGEIYQEDIFLLNELILDLGFKIPELLDQKFINAYSAESGGEFQSNSVRVSD